MFVILVAMESKWMCVFALVVAAAALPMLQAADEYVTVLTTDNFNDHVGGDKAALVEFYAPWYVDCRVYSCSGLMPRKFFFSATDATSELYSIRR